MERGHRQAPQLSLGKLGKWADQPVTSARVDLRGAQAIVSAVKYPDSPISLIKAAMDSAIREGDIHSHAMSALEADRSRLPAVRRDFWREECRHALERRTEARKVKPGSPVRFAAAYEFTSGESADTF